jgi:hypothetical protein
LRAKIGPDEAHPIDEDLSMGTPEAEAEGCGDPTAEAENEVWPDFHPSDEDLSLGAPDFRRNLGPQTRDVCAFG